MITLTFSCKKDSNDQGSGSSTPDAFISGKVHSPSGKTIGSAEIIAGIYKTKSDKNGDFSLPVKAGSYHLVIQTGGGHTFKSIVDVSVTTNQTAHLSYVQGVLTQVGSLAYVPGNWDKIETIIVDSLGYSATQISIADFDNDTLLAGFAAIFINCGALEMGSDNMDSLRYTNLMNYVQNNGSIYASDFAVECLTGDGYWKPGSAQPKHTHEFKGGQVMMNCINPMIGGFIADSSLCTTKSGNSGMVFNAHITDPNIINVLGKDSLDINYDLGGWEVIHTADLPFTSIIHDNGIYGTLAVKMDIDFETNGGKIFYTTFHNEPQGTLSSDVQNILQYFILDL
jgi:hypothetical protein